MPPSFAAHASAPIAAIGGRRSGGTGSARLPVRTWSDTRIVATVPDDARIEGGQWYYVGIQDAGGRWISNIERNITVCRGLE